MVAGFKSRSLQHDTFYENPIRCPSLHVFGETDQIIPKGINSRCLSGVFD